MYGEYRYIISGYFYVVYVVSLLGEFCGIGYFRINESKYRYYVNPFKKQNRDERAACFFNPISIDRIDALISTPTLFLLGYLGARWMKREYFNEDNKKKFI